MWGMLEHPSTSFTFAEWCAWVEQKLNVSCLLLGWFQISILFHHPHVTIGCSTLIFQWSPGLLCHVPHLQYPGASWAKTWSMGWDKVFIWTPPMVAGHILCNMFRWDRHVKTIQQPKNTIHLNTAVYNLCVTCEMKMNDVHLKDWFATFLRWTCTQTTSPRLQPCCISTLRLMIGSNVYCSSTQLRVESIFHLKLHQQDASRNSGAWQNLQEDLYTP